MSGSSAPGAVVRQGRRATSIFWLTSALAGPPFFPGGLLADLEELLGCKVDVVSERGIKPRIKERVLWEAVPL